VTKVNITERSEGGHQIQASEAVAGKLFATTGFTMEAGRGKSV